MTREPYFETPLRVLTIALALLSKAGMYVFFWTIAVLGVFDYSLLFLEITSKLIKPLQRPFYKNVKIRCVL